MNENFFRMDFFLTKVLDFERVNVSISSYLGYESIFLLNSIIDSDQFGECWTKEDSGKKIIRLGKKTLSKEISDIEERNSLQLQAYVNKHNMHGECVLIEKATLEFDVINSHSNLTSKLIMVRGFSFIDTENKNKRYQEYFDVFNQLLDTKP